ncbi:MAG: hypothetical protein NTX50_24925 [Candidatus Sumerlaeota bacterium]|nr:hypothetical protein [Candidatus Sumerlaeota bacterium]
MRSRLTEGFIDRFARLPPSVKELARTNYRRWKANPKHPSLAFKRIHASESIYSVRIGIGWRAAGLLEGDMMTWFWIGAHAEYERLISRR